MKGLMYSELKKEIDTYEKRTPKSRAALAKSWPLMPLGVSSNFRSYEPYPLFIENAKGTAIYDLDGNQYVDFALCFGALMAGHCHPAVVKAVQERLEKGTMFGMPHELEREMAAEICARYPVEQVRFGNSGTEVTMHAIRLARGYTGRDKIIKLEGCYHGVHDAVMVSVKPKPEKWGSAAAPNQVPASAGIPQDTWKNTLIATFNDLRSAERLFDQNPGQIAALILEPVPMNLGIVMPEPGYLEGLRELCTRHGAMLIFDEVKTGAKLARGGACEYFNIKPVVMAAGLATFRHVLTPENYDRINRMSKRLVEGHSQTIKKSGMSAYALGVCANGAVMLYPKTVRNHRDWAEIDIDIWRHYWFGMVNRGVIPQPHWWDEQWTVSVAHSDADVEKHLAAFADLAPALATAQQQRMAAAVR